MTNGAPSASAREPGAMPSAGWPPRHRPDRAAAEGLAEAAARWTIADFGDRASRRRALQRSCAAAPGLEPALGKIASALERAGAVVVEGVPLSDPALVLTATALGEVTTEDNGYPSRLVFDLRPDSARLAALPLHTDSAHLDTPHAIVGLACVEPSADGGGVSLLASAEQVRDALCRADQAVLLQDRCFPFAAQSEDGRPVVLRSILDGSGPTLGVRYRGPLLRRGLELSGRRVDPAHRDAAAAFDEAVRDPALPARVPLRAGDLLLLDNRRVLHGRTGSDNADGRHLKRLKLRAG